MRLFVATDLPPPVRDRLAGLLDEMKKFPLPTRWVRPDSIHLTLRFIGEVPRERFEGVQNALHRLENGVAGPFRLRAEGIGVFPQRGFPRVVWVDMRGDQEAASRLAREVDEALVDIGLPGDSRPFTPHLTLGRVKEKGREKGRGQGKGRGDWRGFLDRYASWMGGDLDVQRFHLYESHLEPGGASYHILGSFGLRGGRPS